ncbi:MAG: DUF4270 family protein [Bacteroidetes bacterium]|nr:DUF4270 family protein [Bacteroidota bacterium]
MKKLFITLKTLALFSLFGLILSFASCVKEPDLVGLSLQSPNEKIGLEFSDTSTIIAYSVIDDSIRTDYDINDILMARIYILNGKQVPAYCVDKMLGTYNDPVFGTTSASIFTQYRLSTISPNFPITQNHCDSIILYLPYSGIYKASDNTSKSYPLQIKVFQLNQKMSLDSSYYAERVLDYNSIAVANTTIMPNTTDSVTYDGVKYPPLLKIKLDNSFGDKFLQNPNFLLDNDVFTSNFKGLYIQSLPLNTTQDNKGAMVYFNLISTQFANLSIYYKKNATDTFSTKYNFVINDQSPKYTHFDHYNYSGSNGTLSAETDFKKQLGLGGFIKDTTLGTQKLYLQSMGGVKVNLKFPNLRSSFKDKKVVINEATLVLKNIDANTYNTAPPLIGLFKKLTGRSFDILPDHLEGFSFIDGSYNATTKEYRIRITRYVQYLLNYMDTDYGLDLVIDRKKSIANRFVFGGTDKSLANRMKLELKYTVIK